MHETIVAERCETFRYCHIGGMGMTSAELKHHAKQRKRRCRQGLDLLTNIKILLKPTVVPAEQ